MSFWDHVIRLNRDWNDLPRRVAIVLLVLALLLLSGALFPYVAPSVIAMVLAWLIKPVAKVLERGFRKLHLPAKLASLIAVLVMYGAITTVLFLVAARLLEELRSLVSALPGWASQAVKLAQQWSAEGGLTLEFASEEALQIINRMFSEALNRVTALASTAVGEVARWTFATTMNVPQIVLFVVLTIMGTFYMVADRRRIGDFFKRWTPPQAADKLTTLKDTVFRGIAGQVRAALIMMALITVELSIGFSVLQVPYAVLLGLVIGVMDALPIIGAGLFLLPMSIYGFVAGNYALGAGTAVLYMLIIVTRQIVEPRVVSVQLGLYPLVTMAAMYAGLRMLGFAGMLLAPVMVLLLKAALSAPGDAAVAEKRKKYRFRRQQKSPPAAGA